jgi:hypothetical protein
VESSTNTLQSAQSDVLSGSNNKEDLNMTVDIMTVTGGGPNIDQKLDAYHEWIEINEHGSKKATNQELSIKQLTRKILICESLETSGTLKISRIVEVVGLIGAPKLLFSPEIGKSKVYASRLDASIKKEGESP